MLHATVATVLGILPPRGMEGGPASRHDRQAQQAAAARSIDVSLRQTAVAVLTPPPDSQQGSNSADKPGQEPASAPDSGTETRNTGSGRDVFEIDQVDTRPWIKTRTMPEYPPGLQAGMTATTVLSFVVDEEGRVAGIAVDQPSSVPLFDQFAAQAFAKARYTPGRVGNRPVKVRMRIAVDFNPTPAGP